MPPPGAATSREAFAKMMTLYAFELTAERYLNDEWVPIRLRNETWDGWIACEVGRESLKPDREELWADQLPEWAVAKPRGQGLGSVITGPQGMRSEEHTSELQSLMRISYAVFCLKKKNTLPQH